MSVIPLTIFFSLLLAGTFVLLFAREQLRHRFSSAERDSLLPLTDETPQVEERSPASAGTRAERVQRSRSTDDHDHAHDHGGDGRCGCRRGVRTPCADCLRRRDEQEPAYF